MMPTDEKCHLRMETALAVLSGVAAATAVASRKVGVVGRNVRIQVPGNEVPGVAELTPMMDARLCRSTPIMRLPFGLGEQVFNLRPFCSLVLVAFYSPDGYSNP